MIGNQLDMFEERKKEEKNTVTDTTKNPLAQQLEIPYEEHTEEVIDEPTPIEKEIIKSEEDTTTSLP